MKQLALFQMTSEAQSPLFAGKAKLEKQSNLSSNIAASRDCFECEDVPSTADEDEIWGDIYDEYEDFKYCSREW